MPLKNLILVIVGLKGEAHGYEILKELEKLAIGLWKPSHSNLYTILGKMVEEGLLEPREEYRGKVRRVKYSLTDRGGGTTCGPRTTSPSGSCTPRSGTTRP